MSLDTASEALLADARAQAGAVLADADREAAERLADAHARAEALIARAREQGEAEGRIERGREEALESLLARTDVLAARRRAYEELRRRARGAVLGLRDEPQYGELLDRLAAAARRDLGAGAQIELDPPGLGGVRATAGSRRVDYTLVTLADRCVDELGPRLPRLWT
ncbi:MAG TPA: V-type ATP synthase subunit E family protein [Solirubrobacteraceae bacterium]|nr:V-type ATP synthase subunit E family protein [Solirubrobacteraceae bacterium]